jgi:hypothetical protein
MTGTMSGTTIPHSRGARPGQRPGCWSAPSQELIVCLHTIHFAPRQFPPNANMIPSVSIVFIGGRQSIGAC